MNYRYDIFISYTRGGEAGDWVRNHFQPQFKGWLEQTMPSQPAIFWDRDIDVGQSWPTALREALAHSRIVVPVVTHPYFRSEWCLAELNTMIARAALVADIGVGPEQIIKPVLFFGEGFPEPIASLQYADMRKWAYPAPVFQQTAAWIPFLDAVKAFAGTVADSLPQAPPWDPHWPVRMGQPAPLAEVELVQL